MESPVTTALSIPIVQQVLTELSIQDTVHDFWDGGRGEANPISEESLVGFRNGIIQLSSLLLPGKSFTDITLGEIKSKGAGTWIGKPSDYERTLIRKYEDMYPSHLYSKTKETITYRDILNDNETGVLRQKYLKNRGYCNILSIQPAEGEFFDSFTTQEKNIIANFILTFMFATPANDNVGQGPYGITYDAGPVAPRKVFSDIEQMYNYIYPQNITDSAATSFKSKKIQYIFPSDSVVRSNRFTQDDVKISFVNKGYNALNRYGFNWEFQDSAGNKIEVPFGPGQSDGPSVNYLVTSILNGGPKNGVREKGTIVNISPIQSIYEQNNGIILDLKRSGDFEQVHASLNNSEAIFATIDHLCSFYARMLHKPCIWSNNGSSEIVMYRFDVGPPPPPDVAFKMSAVFFAQEQVDRIRILSAVTEGSPERASIQQAFEEFRRGQSAYFLTQSKFSAEQLRYMTTPDGYSTDTVDKQGYLADALTTAFLRAKCKDTFDFLTTLVQKISTTRLTRTADQYVQFSQLLGGLVSNPDMFEVQPSGVSDRFTLSYTGQQPPVLEIEKTITALKSELEGLGEVLDLQITGQPFYKKLFESVSVGDVSIDKYDHKASHSMFDFSSGHLKSIHTAFRAMIGILFTGRSGRDRGKKAFSFLTHYFTARDVLLGTFRNEAFAEELRKQSDIAVSDLIVDDTAIPELGRRSIDMVRAMFTSFKPLTSGGNIGKTRRHKNSLFNRTQRAKIGGQDGIPTRIRQPVKKGIDAEAQRKRRDERLMSMRKGTSEEVRNNRRGISFGSEGERIGQTTDLDLLFRDICGKAAGYVESVISTGIPTPGDGGDKDIGQEAMNQLFDIPTSVQIIQDIAIQWETELLRIREDAEDNYDESYVPTQSEGLISLLVSTYTESTGTYLLDTPIPPREQPEYQDFFGALLMTPVPVVRTLLVLTIFDNMLSGKDKTQKYLRHLTPVPTVTYSAFREWNDKLPRDLYSVVNIVNTYKLAREPGRLFGGERRPLYITIPSEYPPSDSL